jgi:hypothetical protein
MVLRGTAKVNGETIGRSGVGTFSRQGNSLRLEAADDLTALLLTSAPIAEPIVGHGPFVMNTREEIRQAVDDYQHVRMGHL